MRNGELGDMIQSGKRKKTTETNLTALAMAGMSRNAGKKLGHRNHKSNESSEISTLTPVPRESKSTATPRTAEPRIKSNSYTTTATGKETERENLAYSLPHS